MGLLGVRLELLGREEDGLVAERQKLHDATAEDQTRQAQAETSLAAALAEIHTAQHAVEGERHHAVSVLTRLANHRTNLVNLERRRTDLGARVTRLTVESEQLAARAGEIKKQRDELAEKLLAAQDKRKHLHEQKAAQEAALQTGRAE